MTFLSSKDTFLEIAAGRYPGLTSVNKFGRATDVDSTDTDIWDGANSADSLTTWVAPTQARIHNIASTSASDTSAGVGARTIRVQGLTSWSTMEVSEDVTMNGTTNVATANSYVIIHRLQVLTKGATSANVGTITATAVTDSTVTAQIMPDQGQTQMAIYGLPGVQRAYLTEYYASAVKASSSLAVAISLVVNPEPDSQLTNFLVKHTQGITTEGANYISNHFRPYPYIDGPAIIKIRGNSSSAGTDVTAGFDLILEEV